MRAFVTGATGLLGNNLVRQLIAEGHQVTALVRSAQRAAQLLRGLDVRFVEGDLADVATFAPQLAGHDVVFHTAAFFREYYQPGDHWATLQALNIDATIALLNAAEALGVRRFVHTSSSGTLGKTANGAPADETTPPDQLVHANLYFRSKLLGDQAIAAWMPGKRLEVITIMPGWMFGPGDAAPTSAGRLVADLLGRRIPLAIPGYAAPTDARDVAIGMVRAAEKANNGDRFVLSRSGYEPIYDIFQLIGKVSGVPAPTIRAPYWMAFMFAATVETISRITNKPASASVEGIRTFQEPHPLSSAKAIRELGVSFRPLEETMRDTVNWLRAERPDLIGGSNNRTAPRTTAVS